MYKFPEETLKALRENRLETLDLGSLGFNGKTTLSGHSWHVTSLALLSDGRLASGSWDNTIRVWDLLSSKSELTLTGHEESVTSLTILPDGHLASGSLDKTVRLWNVESGKCEAVLPGHKRCVYSLTTLPDGRLISGSYDDKIRLWKVNKEKCEATLFGDEDRVSSLLILPDDRLASGSIDKMVRIWNVKSGECEAVLPGHKDSVHSLAMLPDARLASGSYDSTIRIWNVKSSNCEAILTGHEESVTSLAILPDGRLTSGSSDKTVRIWNVKSGECEAILSHEDPVFSLTMTQNGRLAAGTSKGYIKLWPIAPDKSLFLSLKSSLERNNTLKKIEWSGCESLFNNEEHAWLENLLMLNQAGRMLPAEPPETVIAIAVPVPVIELATGGASAEASSLHDEIKKLKEQLSAQHKELEEKNKQLEILSTKLEATTPFTIIKFKDLILGKKLGKGTFGEVWEAKWKEKDVAVKSLLMEDLPEKLALEFKSEALLQAGLHHDNIVELKGVCLEPKKYALVMELMPKNSLFSVLHNGKDLPWSFRLSIAKDIANGLNYLHQNNVIHQDLKSLNVLIGNGLRAKLADFGLSEIKANTADVGYAGGTDSSKPGSISWMAPERFERGSKATEASDIYAMGMIFWELASRALPYKDAGKNDYLIIKWVTENKGTDREPIHKDTPPKIASLIRKCWAQKAEDRPASAELVLSELMTVTLTSSITSEGARAGAGTIDSGYPIYER